MRDVIHLAVNAKSARASLGRKGRDDAAGMRQIGLRRREARVDCCNLIGVNCDTADKTVTARYPAALREAVRILEIRIQGIEGQNIGRAGGKQALRSRHLIRESPVDRKSTRLNSS